ncbi:C40 family peptidase [Antrihabitans cavernicola]|uniref:NlpC/P60 family protein n=1 Tax=Antrihabitans cavernicola TaxID=2495913 RepID=A0A5A7SFT6_9NOCA|nr:C40 family peptidase [Spelaeibacter cavernicola]KAA0023111.1 NlpC/P60 family protein [Spelaeibacter cavernicola]
MASLRSKRSVGGVCAVAVLSIALAATPASPAAADPVALPSNATEAMQRLTDLSRQSEQTNEALNKAKVDADQKAAQERDAEGKQAADQAAVDAAKAKVAQFQPAVDRIAVATYQGARPNRLFSVLLSDSPQQLLDQMSALDVISSETAAKVDQYKQATAAASAAEDASRKSADAARSIADQANAVNADLQKKQGDLQAQIAEVTQAWAKLSGSEQSMLAGTPFPPGFDPSILLKGLSGSGAGALQAGLTRIGDPYVWGATGPNQFDCSGLVQWAYKQIGKNLPRTSEAQAAGGIPVSRDQLEPGDVVLFYPDASHVGIYAGNGNVLHASTFGVPVKVAPMGDMPFYGARRY